MGLVAIIVIGVAVFSKPNDMLDNNANSEEQNVQQEEEKQEILLDVGIKKSEAVVGKEVTFGSYVQKTWGEPGEIEWIIVSVSNGKAFLVSKYILDYKPYNEKYEDITWAECSIREWLNNDFYKTAFTEAERNFIQLSTLENKAQTGSLAEGVDGKVTNDYVFLLSCSEIYKYLKDNRVTEPTDYAAEVFLKGNRNEMYINQWFTRTTGRTQSSVAEVHADGSVSTVNGGGMSVAVESGIRPAIWVELVD